MATKNLTVRIRCTEREKADWQNAAGGERAFSDWARRTLNNEAQQREDKTSPEFEIESADYPNTSGAIQVQPASGKRSYEPDFK